MTSAVEQNSQEEKYLFDHIYIDHSRVSHYYAQSSEIGLISGSKKSGKKTQKDLMSGAASAGLIKGSYSGETTSEDGFEHQIDPNFSRPHETLNILYEEGYIHDGFSGAAIGNLVLVKGSLALSDTKILKNLFKDVSLMEMHNAAAFLPAKNKQQVINQKTKDIERINEVVSKIPFMLQGTLTSNKGACWFSLNPDNLSISPEDFIYKHGSNIQGEWNILGVLDALPDSPEEIVPQDGSDIQKAMLSLQALLRMQLGRNPLNYGITPIMIFRVVRPSGLPEYLRAAGN